MRTVDNGKSGVRDNVEIVHYDENGKTAKKLLTN